MACDDDLPAGEEVAALASAGWVPSYSEAIAVHADALPNLDRRVRALATKIADEIPSVDPPVYAP